MEKTFAKAEELAGTMREYINTRIESVKLTAAEKSSALIGNAAAAIFALVVFSFFMIFGGVALSLLLGEWIGKSWAGFLIVAGLFLLISLVLWYGRERLIRIPVVNAIIRQLFKDDEKD